MRQTLQDIFNSLTQPIFGNPTSLWADPWSSKFKSSQSLAIVTYIYLEASLRLADCIFCTCTLLSEITIYEHHKIQYWFWYTFCCCHCSCGCCCGHGQCHLFCHKFNSSAITFQVSFHSIPHFNSRRVCAFPLNFAQFHTIPWEISNTSYT